MIEFTFDMNTDASKGDDITDSKRVNFNKVQLQQFFEELEKIQLKLDELTNWAGSFIYIFNVLSFYQLIIIN